MSVFEAKEISVSFGGLRALNRVSFTVEKNEIFSIIGLLPSGDLSFCGIGQTEKALVIGNIHRDDLPTLWRKASILRTLREQLPGRLEGICGKCLMKGLCLGECRALAYSMHKNLMGPYWICQEAFNVSMSVYSARILS